MKILLVDNGSLEPTAVRALRDVAARLSARVGQLVFPVSMAHSDKIPAGALGGGGAAVCIEAFLRGAVAGGERDFVILPFFIGPSRAVTHALPKIVERVCETYPSVRVRIAPVLHEVGDDTLARILADRVRKALETADNAQRRVRVALVDHGSPTHAVTAVRDAVAAELGELLRDAAAVMEVAGCSMERRAAADYAFNEPLLEPLLRRELWVESTVIVAPLFLLPGRHAGGRGDIAQICTRARASAPKLRTLQTAPLTAHPLLIGHLARRLEALLSERD